MVRAMARRRTRPGRAGASALRAGVARLTRIPGLAWRVTWRAAAHFLAALLVLLVVGAGAAEIGLPGWIVPFVAAAGALGYLAVILWRYRPTRQAGPARRRRATR